MKLSINSVVNGTYSPVEDQQGLIIFVHGLTSSQDEPIISQWELYFNHHWYSTFRFNLYGDWDNERKLITNSLSENIQDINDVVNYFVEKWEKNIILIWHSFGGLGLLYSNLSAISKTILWDASIGWDELLSDVYEDEQWKYIDRWDHHKRYIGEKMYQDFCTQPEYHIKQLQSLKTPVVILCAEHGLQEPAIIYAKSVNQQVFVVTWADHIFSEDNHKQKLFELTLWKL